MSRGWGRVAIAAVIGLLPAVALGQPAGRGGGGSFGGGSGSPGGSYDTASSAAGIPWAPMIGGAVILLVVVTLFRALKLGGASTEPVRPAAGTASVSTFALRTVAGILTWLGGIVAVLALGAAAVAIIAGVAADHALVGVVGASPAVGVGLAALVVMALGQLLGCIAAIEAHARELARHAAQTAEETAALRAVVMGRLPKPEPDVATKKRTLKRTKASEPGEHGESSASIPDSEEEP